MNHITIAGRVEEDPVRKEANGSVVCTFRLASGRSGSKTGRLWIDIETWGPLAGVCYKHLRKGRRVIVAGRLAQKQWADPASGEKRTRFVVAASEVDFLTPPPSTAAEE
ncbi:MAG: single-stranded DNA-binding protein [Ilumatobacteraceae bacterium]